MRQLTLAVDSAEGVPSKSVMRSNWCTTFFPGNSGFPVSISANMHPMLQVSIAGVYCKTKKVIETKLIAIITIENKFYKSNI